MENRLMIITLWMAKKHYILGAWGGGKVRYDLDVVWLQNLDVDIWQM